MLFSSHVHPHGRICKWDRDARAWKFTIPGIDDDGNVATMVCKLEHPTMLTRMPKTKIERRYCYVDSRDENLVVGVLTAMTERKIADDIWLDQFAIVWVEERVVYEPEPWEVSDLGIPTGTPSTPEG